jgi:hypothetical protein
MNNIPLHFSIDGHRGDFLLLTDVNSAAEIMGVQMSL